MCTRQFQNKIADSVYSLLALKIEEAGLNHIFKLTDNSITCPLTGSDFLFYGRARNIEEIKGTEGVDIHWAEECHLMTEAQWRIIDPTLRKQDSQHWLIFNPDLMTDFVYQRFVVNPPPNTIVRQIDYPENPFLSQTMLDVIKAAKEEDYDEYMHIYRGVPRTNDEQVVIKRGWIQAAIDAHLTVQPKSGRWDGGVIVGYDVADDGGDKNATVAMDGSVLVDIDEWSGGEDKLTESVARVRQKAAQLDAVEIGYDSIGVGAFVGSTLNSMGWQNHYKFNAGGAVARPDRLYGETRIKNKDFFANLKAQAWWLLADRFRNTYNAVTKGVKYDADQMISISSKCDARLLNKLMDELSTPKRDFDGSGSKVKVESKKDLAKPNREGGAVKSPNLADATVIACSRWLASGGKGWFDL